MFSVNLKNKRVVIEHTVQASDEKVDLHTTFDLQDVPGERVLLWAVVTGFRSASCIRNNPAQERRSEKAI